MKKLALLLLPVLVITSCTVTRNITFNADRSGTMDNTIDMTGLVSMLGEEGGGGMGNMGDMSQFGQSKAALEAVPGITNVNVTYDTTGILNMKYSFANVDALNKSLNAGGNSMDMLGGQSDTDKGKTKEHNRITYKGKKFVMEEVDKKTRDEYQKGEKKEEMAQAEMMMASSQIITNITFPSDVKKVSYKNASVTNGKTVSYTTPFKELLSKDYKPLIINLK